LFRDQPLDYTFHNTVSVLKTMECLLGIPPMCQNDAVATPIGNWDAAPANDAAYEALWPNRQILAEINGASNPTLPVSPALKSMMDQSKAMDFTVADRAPAELLNRIIWQTVKGPGAIMPASPTGPTPTVARPKDDDDD
jgi:hypothetical protein